MKLYLLSAAVFISAAVARSQSEMYVIEGTQANQQLGKSVAGPGDLSGDGVPEILVTLDDGVRAYDGATGAELWTIAHPGYSRVRAIDDIDSDSVGDFVVAGQNSDVLLYSGATQTVLHRWPGPFYEACVPGDIDGDGFDDVAVAESGSGDQHIRVYSGITYQEILDIDGPGSSSGHSLAGAGDCDGDGVPDIVAGYYQSSSARLYSGATGALLYSWFGDDWLDEFGSRVAGVGDVNADGRDDVAVAAWIEWSEGDGPPYVDVYSGMDGTRIHHLEYTGAWFADHAILGVGDVDGDGADDFQVGYSVGLGTGSGYEGLQLISGMTGAVLYTLGDGGASELALAGDLDGDGWPEVIRGQRDEHPNGYYSGRVRVFRLACGPTPRNYCTSAPNSAGSGAIISYEGWASLSHNDFLLVTTGVVPSTYGFYYYGPKPIEMPFGHGYRCVGVAGGIGVFRLLPATLSTAAGVLGRPLDFTQPPLSSGPGAPTAGSTWYFQLWYRDVAAGGPQFNLSDGLGVTFCP